jgi:hypothetical protein
MSRFKTPIDYLQVTQHTGNLLIKKDVITEAEVPSEDRRGAGDEPRKLIAIR